MLRFLGLLTLIFLIYRWVVRPLLIIPQDNQRQRREDMANWMQDKFREFQQRQQNPPRNSRKKEEEYTDYEDVE